MRTPERPFDGQGSEDSDTPSYDWLDEWLCEYVDGTMDPSLEAVFEKYVEANPELKAHVKRLRQTRELLCGCDLSEEAATETQRDVCTTVEKDLLEQSASALGLTSRWGLAATFTSSIAAALVVGFFAGTLLMDPIDRSARRATPTAEERPPQMRATPSPVEAVDPTPPFDASFAPDTTPDMAPPRAVHPPGSDTALGGSPFTTVDAR